MAAAAADRVLDLYDGDNAEHTGLRQRKTVSQMSDSHIPLVGAQRLSIPMPEWCCSPCKGARIDQNFVTDVLWALQCAVGVLLAALPTYLAGKGNEWMDGWTLDLSYAAIMCVFVSGRTVGETLKLIWQALMGSITAAIAPQLAINTFGDGWLSVAVFVLFYTLIVLSMPMTAITKKFALGITLNYLMHSAKHSAEPPSDLEPALPSSVTYEVLVLGLWGCGAALVSVTFPYPRLATWAARSTASSLVTDIDEVVHLLLRGYCDGQTALDRTRLVTYFAKMEHSLADMARYLDDAWYEPKSTHTCTKLGVVLKVVYKLRAELYGMQQALTEEQSKQVNEENFDDVMKNLRVPIYYLVESSLGLLHEVDSLIHKTQANTFVGAAAAVEQTSVLGMKHSAARQSIKAEIENLLGKQGGALDATTQSLSEFHYHLSKLRDTTKEHERNSNIRRSERIEMDNVLMMFLFSVTGFAQQLLDFPDEYAETMEEAVEQSRQNKVFAADTKMVALQFQKKQLVAAQKTAVCLAIATSCNAYYFDYEATGPVIIAYVMAGHVGSSYANTVSRVLGVLVGATMSFCVLIFAHCSVAWLAVMFVVIISLASFVRFTSPQASYMGLSAAVAACPILVRHWDSCDTEFEIKEQYDIVRQVVFSCSLLAFFELFPISTTTGLENLQKKVSDTLTECKTAFKDMSEYNATVYSGRGFDDGSSSKPTDPKKMLNKIHVCLWASIPGYLREQSVFLEDAKAEPTLWRTEFPASAYTRVVDSSIRISVHLMLLRNAWKRLNELAQEQKSKGRALLMDQPHVKARELEVGENETDPQNRPVQASVQVKIGPITRIRDLVREECDRPWQRPTDEGTFVSEPHLLPTDGGPIDVKKSQRIVNGRRNKDTEVTVQLPNPTPRQAKELEKRMLAHDIVLMWEYNKEFNNAGRTEVHVPAVRCLTASHQMLLGKLDTDGNKPEGACTDGFELRSIDETKPVVGVVAFNGGVQMAVRRVKWLYSLGRDSPTDEWRVVAKGEGSKQFMIKDELQFDFIHGNIMKQVGILSLQITAGFQELAATLRLNAVFDKELGSDDNTSFFQTPGEYDASRNKHVSTLLHSEVTELANQFQWALHESLHISQREQNPLTIDDNTVDWDERQNDNEDMLVLYGICKNYEGLVEALLETDSVMFNGDDLNLLRTPSMLHAHAWTADDLASTFSPAGQGPSWYRLGHNPAIQ